MQRRLAYGDVYAAAFEHRDDVDRWCWTVMESDVNFLVLACFCRLVLHMHRTQVLGSRFSVRVVRRARLLTGLEEVTRVIRLRRLQQALLRYLWRPGGTLMVRYMSMVLGV